jgi:hypothetical protein
LSNRTTSKAPRANVCAQYYSRHHASNLWWHRRSINC